MNPNPDKPEPKRDPRRVAFAVCSVLLEQWKAETAYGEPAGCRVFLRMVCATEALSWWEDWKLVAAIKPEGLISLALENVPPLAMVAEQLRANPHAAAGWFQCYSLAVNWARTNCPDGPLTPRVSDRPVVPDYRRKRGG